MKTPLLLYTADGDPVYRTGPESYTLKPKRGFHQLTAKHQVSTLLDPDSHVNRTRLAKIKRQTGADCVWKEEAA